jgi:hypothetical protein
MDAIVSRISLGDGEKAPGHIALMIPYWIYRRVCAALTAMGATTKPEDYIVAVLEGHVRRLNL